MSYYKKKYFGTDGIRGKANSTTMNAEMALKIGMAAAEFFTRSKKTHYALIGKDTRLSNYTIEPALVAGFLSMGMNVYLTGPIPTPGVSALVRSMRCDVGIMISASHNQYTDNGIKIFDPMGCKLSDKQEAAIEKLIDIKNRVLVKSESLGRAKRIDDAGGRYIEYLKSKISFDLKLNGIKIVIDCANGAAYKVAPLILWELGAEVIPINVSPDGKNVNKKSGSTNTSDLIKEVLKNKADVGVALDGDADRVIIIDEKGKQINGDCILAILASHLKEENDLENNTVIGTVLSNKGLEDYLKINKINFLRANVGDRNIIKEMKKEKCFLGGEPSGHIILGNNNATGDGILAALEILGIMIKKQKKLSTLAKIFSPYPQVSKDYIIKQSTKADKIIQQSKSEILKLRTGLKRDIRLVIRKSGTENKIRIMAESRDKKLANKIVSQSLDILNRANV